MRYQTKMQQRHCVFCNLDAAAWLPFQFTEDDFSPFLMKVGITGSNLRRFYCPHCRSIDRERHLKLYMDRLQLWDCCKGSLLHMAPEAAFAGAIHQHQPSRYVVGDLQPRHALEEKIDMEAIPYPDATFDVVICNHVLEHVNRPGIALSEARRILRHGGRLICQTPFARRLSTTLEDPLLQSEDDRWFFYAQHNHLRLFGLDIEQLIRRAGFVGSLRAHSEVLPDVDPEELGVNEFEPFFDFTAH
jgi:SAM-dependent methyltransferase